ncbi:2-succinyl-5-enolpyruvyl-6-hydroxy-3-cyclohexene-1-carboxylic-acid synthase [Bacillus pinisoli]|uniref:2-succinyl-5-enolpyruvyl-6-hydroxy-3- cyclohexene-1-carboxylic-acid synthase n=1 Tax=Bacillus pinisoli TaxID=2901866 RepID=UPI001FF3A7C7|nr:2-succinyl-5-enolpyruvyl-6-hydroxy-3-cyclohexene-1-carboxylic-acid synthase [Bacillus pinisoli]
MSDNLALTHYLATFIEGLVKSGVEDVVISPGSRSTPIAILMEEHPSIKTWINIDERSAAFFALGIAKASRKPVALLCTSGTAAANYYPAIVEATHSKVPLIVLTADRPHELRDVGAPQAINQIDLYGKYSKWFVEMALPESTTNLLHYSYTVATRAVATSLSSPAGVVHLNFPLREPLVPNLEELQWNITESKKTVIQNGRQQLSPEVIPLLKNIAEEEKGLIVCGPHDQKGFSEAVIALAEQLGYPVLADPLSQVRSGSHSKDMIIDCYDTILKSGHFFKDMKPNVIIRFGAMPVSKVLMQFMTQAEASYQLIVDADEGWRDPTLTGTHFIHINEIDFCEQMKDIVSTKKTNREYSEKWKHANEIVKPVLHAEVTDFHFEGDVVRHLVHHLEDEVGLFIGNSMPIRDIDTFFMVNNRRIRLFANRGANGIDGITSTALGVSTKVKKLVLLVGDLTFYHDLNGLLASKLYNLPITIIVVNNNGGGIFSFLPQSKEEKHFEQLFGTPIHLDYEKVVSMYDGNFKRVRSWAEFNEEVARSLASNQLHVIEVPTAPRDENVVLHRQLWNEAIKKLEGTTEWK